MKKSKYDVENAVAAFDGGPIDGQAHALHLLLLAISKSNPAIGALLDEFTAMHAEYLAEMQMLARESEPHLLVVEAFSKTARDLYKRLSAMDADQAALVRSSQSLSASLTLH